ncbi:hypothetical protein ANRL3_01292 [Anaerolineae bacterium]|nr:hypothetical protein ANRL3_01292 [Anaerolineae bacterium]
MAKPLKVGERYKVFFPKAKTELGTHKEFYLFIQEDGTIRVEANFVGTHPVATKERPYSNIVLSIEDIPPK